MSTKRRTSVLMTNMYAGIGGGELAFLDHTRALATDFYVFCVLLEDGPIRARLEAAGNKVYVWPFFWGGGKLSSALRLIRCISWFIRHCLHHRPAALVCYTFNDLVLAGIAARLCRVPIVYRGQGDVVGANGSWRCTWLGRLFKPIISFIRPHVACTTALEQSLWVEKRPARLSGIELIPLGTDLSRAESARRSEAAIRKSLSLDSRFVVGLFARLTRMKGHDILLRALQRLLLTDLEVVALIVGDAKFGDGDEYVQTLQRMVTSFKLDRQVRFLGFREDAVELMAACDVICQPSRWEPFGLSIIEAMAVGRPIVASDLSGPRESVIDGRTGFLVTPEDHKILAERLLMLAQQPQMRNRLGAAGMARVTSHFDSVSNLRRLVDYCRLVSGEKTGHWTRERSDGIHSRHARRE